MNASVKVRRCSVCEKTGHYAATCPERKKYTANNFSDGRMNNSMVERSKKQATGATPKKNNKGSMIMAQDDKKALKAMFDSALSADAEVAKLEEKKEALIRKRSEAVKTIADKFGKGPFSVAGQLLEIRSRKGMKDGPADSDGEPTRVPDGTENFFFVRRGDGGVTTVD